MIENRTPLSRAGLERRELILQQALRVAIERRKGRRNARLLLASVPLIVLALIFVRIPPGPRKDVVVDLHNPGPPTIAAVARVDSIERIQTDPNIVARLSVQIRDPKWQVVDDRQLLDSLADAGRPAGLVEINGKTQLVMR